MANLRGTTFSELSRIVREDRPVKIGNNTTAEVGQDIDAEGGTWRSIVVRLHGHAIATLHHSGSVTIDTCGWDTVTTRERLNQLVPGGYRIFRQRGDLSIRYPGGSVGSWDGEKVTLLGYR